MAEAKQTTAQALAFSAVYLAAQIVMVRHHEMWRDELQAWLLARDSGSVMQLFQNLRYEGHPALWHLLLMPFTRLFDGPEIMQYLHVVIASGSVFLLVRFAPFGGLPKLLLSLSYFLFYEYSQLARNYALGVLLAFMFCSLFPHRGRHIVLVAVILFLLAQTSVFGTILSLALAAALLTEKVAAARASARHLRFFTGEAVAGIIILAGIVLAVVQMKPPADTGFAEGWFFDLGWKRLNVPLQALVGGYLPFPLPGMHYWGSLLLFLALQGIWKAFIPAILVLAIVGLFALSLLGRPAALVAYLLVTAACLAFFYVKYPGGLRHHGFLFIALILSLWIAPHCTAWNGGRGAAIGRLRRLAPGLLLLMLTVQAYAGVTAAVLDYRYTFSQARNAAGVIAARAGPDDLLVGAVDYAASAVAGYLHRPVYYVNAARYGTFVRWDRERTAAGAASPPDLDAALTHGHRVFVISDGSSSFAIPGLSATAIYASEEAVVSDETFVIYEISR